MYLGLMPWVSRLVSLIFVLLMVGLMPEIAGIDPAQAILRARAGAQQLLTPEALQAVRDDLQLSSYALGRFWNWLLKALQGDLGSSWVNNTSVSLSIWSSLKTSLLLMLSALSMSLVFCFISVIFTAKRWRKNLLNQNNTLFSSVLVSLPEYVFALLLILLFSITLGWLPPYGWQNIENLWLPSLALALPAAGYFSRLLNDSLKRVLNEAWVITWLSSNISHWQIFRFALWRALSNLISQIALLMIGLTGGAVAVEQIFAIPGLGRLILSAAKAQDLPMLQGGLLVLFSFSIFVSSLSILLQRQVLGRSLSSGKLIAAHSEVGLTKSKVKLGLSFGIFLLLAFCALWAQFRDPFAIEFARLASVSMAAPFGADALGRDLLARLGNGMLFTLKTGMLATFVSLLIGMLMGFAARFSQGAIEISKGLPYIIMGLLVAGLLNMSEHSAFIAVVLVAWAPLASHCASLVLEAKAQPYTHLAPIWGVSNFRILRYYLLPYVLPPLIKHALLRFPVITLSLTSLSFIGLGAKPPSPEWGLLIAENLPYIERAPQAVLLPITGLVLISVAINLLFED